MTKDEYLKRCEKILDDYDKHLITKKECDKRLAEEWSNYRESKCGILGRTQTTDCQWK